jgi:hypothetical protein
VASEDSTDRQVLDQLRLIGDRIAVLGDRQSLVTDHLAALDARFNAMGDRVATLGERVDLSTEEAALLRREFFDRFDTLGRNVAGLEKDVQALARRVMGDADG